MTTTPTAYPELPDLDKLEAYATSSKNGDWHATEAMLNMLDEDDVLALVAAARRAQPEGEAPPRIDEAVMTLLIGHTKLSQDGIDDYVQSIARILNRVAVAPVPDGELLPEGEAPQAEPVARVIAGEWGKKVAFLANGKDAPKVGTLLYTESGKETAQLSIGFANNDQGVHVSVIQRHPDDAITLLHQAKVPAGDSFAHFSIAVKQAAVPRTDLSKRIRAAATADVTLAQAKLLIGAAEEIERAQQTAAPTWGAVHTVGDMVRNLLTLDQAAPIFTASHVTIDRVRRCRTREVTISKERVVDGKWIDSTRMDVPYTHIIWAKPDEPARQAVAPGALYSYMGESGRYELLGHAVGAGKCRLIDTLTVYRDTATGNLYFRHPSDFAARMVAIEGNASSGQGTSEAPQTAAARDVLAERQRQVKAEGYDHENDDNYVNDEMAAAAAFYVMPPGVREWPMDGTGYGATMGQAIYPDWMPPKIGDRRRDLVKGAALALAEIERLDRAAAPKGGA